ncbi:hypothetical protein AAFF_G00166270 [Aldrovandia affinis]|uniref:Uncharacterized protein n=1 Tax=Aldrovandia affinis TaxID=143900 RepID=A0AAD7W7M8_9TELE|nr:hypothetical protein AAFF_G00166270 [Aldrovandia affinis]
MKLKPAQRVGREKNRMLLIRDEISASLSKSTRLPAIDEAESLRSPLTEAQCATRRRIQRPGRRRRRGKRERGKRKRGEKRLERGPIDAGEQAARSSRHYRPGLARPPGAGRTGPRTEPQDGQMFPSARSNALCAACLAERNVLLLLKLASV